MGSSSSSNIGGGWVQSKCDCKLPDSQRIKKVRWIRVPLAGRFVDGAANFGSGLLKVATLGLAGTINGGIKDCSHECVEILFDCDQCGKSSRYTLEFGDHGKKMYEGHYPDEYGCRGSFTSSRLTMREVRSIYADMWSSGYSLTNRNCCHWSRRFFNRAKRQS